MNVFLKRWSKRQLWIACFCTTMQGFVRLPHKIFVSLFMDCNFLFIYHRSFYRLRQRFFFSFQNSCLFIVSTHVLSSLCIYIHAAHVPTPCSLPPQSLFLPLHAPYPSILFSLKPPHWPSPSNRMIIWHNVTPPDAWWGLSQLHPPSVPVAGVWGWGERKMGEGRMNIFEEEKREFHARIITWPVSTS